MSTNHQNSDVSEKALAELNHKGSDLENAADNAPLLRSEAQGKQGKSKTKKRFFLFGMLIGILIFVFIGAHKDAIRSAINRKKENVRIYIHKLKEVGKEFKEFGPEIDYMLSSPGEEYVAPNYSEYSKHTGKYHNERVKSVKESVKGIIQNQKQAADDKKHSLGKGFKHHGHHGRHGRHGHHDQLHSNGKHTVSLLHNIMHKLKALKSEYKSAGHKHGKSGSSWKNFMPEEFDHHGCETPVEGERYVYQYNPEEFGRFVFSSLGRQYTDVKVVTTDKSEFSVHINTFYSSPDIVGSVVVTSSESGDKDEDTNDEFSEFYITKDLEHLKEAKFRARGPKFLKRGQCIKVYIEFVVPESVKHIQELGTGFVVGNYSVDPKVTESVQFGKFYFGSLYSHSVPESINANVLSLHSIKSTLKGKFNVAHVVSASSIVSPIDLNINIKNPHHKSNDYSIASEMKTFHINTRSVFGDVEVDVSKSYSGKFDVRSTFKETEVSAPNEDDISYEKNTKHYKSGTYNVHKEEQ
ncbi:hypothetical protein BB560_006024, partial [Smittium megazygosporum]